MADKNVKEKWTLSSLQLECGVTLKVLVSSESEYKLNLFKYVAQRNTHDLAWTISNCRIIFWLREVTAVCLIERMWIFDDDTTLIFAQITVCFISIRMMVICRHCRSYNGSFLRNLPFLIVRSVDIQQKFFPHFCIPHYLLKNLRNRLTPIYRHGVN